MFVHNPFAALPASIPPIAKQTYVAVMFLLVICGTLFDLAHKGSASYFFKHRRAASFGARRKVSTGEAAALAAETIAVSVLASGEFCSMWRRIAHLLTMYGFLVYVVTTAIMVFAYPTPAAPGPAILPALWYLGAVGLPRRLLVLVLHPRRRRRGRQFAVSPGARRPVHRFASGERDAGPVMGGLQTARQPHLGKCVSCSVSARHDGAVWLNSRGPSSLICSSSPPRPFRNGSNRRTASRSNLPAPADRPATFGSARRPAAELLISASLGARTGDNAIMPTFVYMTSCDGCGHCVDICPSDIMHIDHHLPPCL